MIRSRLAAVAAAIGAFLVLLWRVFAAGERSQEAKQAKAELEALKNANEVEQEIDGLDADGVSERLDRWRVRK